MWEICSALLAGSHAKEGLLCYVINAHKNVNFMFSFSSSLAAAAAAGCWNENGWRIGEVDFENVHLGALRLPETSRSHLRWIVNNFFLCCCLLFFVLAAESLASLVDKKCSGGFLAGGKKERRCRTEESCKWASFWSFFLPMVFMEPTAELRSFCYLAKVCLGVKVKWFSNKQQNDDMSAEQIRKNCLAFYRSNDLPPDPPNFHQLIPLAHHDDKFHLLTWLDSRTILYSRESKRGRNWMIELNQWKIGENLLWGIFECLLSFGSWKSPK